MVGCSGSHHCVQHGQEFARASDDDELLGLSGCKQVLFERPEPRVEPAGSECCQIERSPDRAASTSYAAFAASMSGIIGMWCKSCERRDTSSVQIAKFRELRDQGC